MSNYGSQFRMYVLMVVIVVLLYTISGVLVSPSKAIHAAEDLGYTNIRIVSKDIWFTGFKGCGGGDSALFIVHGTGPDGKQHDLTVCAGIFKGGTVRSR